MNTHIRPTSKASICALMISALIGVTANAQTTKTYEYDALGRLIEVEDDADDEWINYEYDAAGNRTRVSNAAAFSVADASAAEGNTVTFTVTRLLTESTAVSVNYATSYGTAGSGDLTLASGTLNFAADDTSEVINVSTTEDAHFESTETFTVTLSSPSSGSFIEDATATGTITDDDIVRDYYGTLQAGFTESMTYNWHLGYIYRTKLDSTIIHMTIEEDDLGPGYCNTGVAPISGYSWTSNGCEMAID